VRKSITNFCGVFAAKRSKANRTITNSQPKTELVELHNDKMKDTTTSVLGFDVPVTGQPETLEECVAAAGGEDKLVGGWVDYIRFHKTNSAARSAVVDALEDGLNIKRATEMVKKGTKADPNRMVEQYAESEQTFADRAIAQSGKTRAEVWDMIKEAVGSIPFRGEGREGGPGRLAKQDTVKAQTLIDAADKWPTAVSLLESKNPGLKIEMDEGGKPKVESLAQALRTNRKRLENEENASLGLAA
jgi:hypothetical protein